MTTRRKPRKWTESERSAIMTFCELRIEDSEKAVTKLREGLKVSGATDMVVNGIRYWSHVQQGYEWGLGLLRKGVKDGGQRKAVKNGGSK